MEGESKVRGSLTLLEGSRWRGDMEVTNAVICGEVEGNVVAAGHLEIRAKARVHGSVHANIVAVAEGARIDGEIRTSSEAPPVRFREKRKRSQ